MPETEKMKTLQDFTARQLCIHCKGGECADDTVEEDAMVLCECCMDHGAHLKCLRTAGINITSEEIANPSFQWFCSEACKRVSTGLVDATNQRRPLEKSGIYTSEVVRYSEKYRSSQNVVGTVVSMFHSTFGPSQYSDGSDLVELVCKGANHTIPDADADEQPPDCSNFLNFILRKGGNIVAAAVIRAHGTLLAEVPFVVTREGYRREGNCRRLLSALDKMLNDFGVQWLVLPALEVTVPIWKGALGFEDAPDDAVEQLEERIIVPDDTKILLKKVGSLATTQSTHSGKGSKLKRVRFSLPRATLEESDDSDEDDEEKKIKKRGKRSRKKGSDDEEEFTLDAAEAELDGEDDDDEEEDGEDAGHGNGCSQCGTLTAKKLHEDEETGDLLCTLCHTSRGGAAAAAAGTSGATTATTASGGKACYHCRNDEVSKLHSHKASGGWECGTCRRYRTSHNGELRPARLFNRRMRARTASPATATAGANSGGTTPLTIATPLNYNTNHLNQQQQRQVQNRTAALVPGQNGIQANRYASAQKRPLRLRERVFSKSTQVIKTCSIVNKGSFTMDTMKSNYAMQSLAYGANQVTIEILAAERKEEESGNTDVWGDLRRQIIEADAAKRRAEHALVANTNNNTTAGLEAVQQERQKRIQIEEHLENLMKKMELMEQQAAKQQEIIANLQQNNQPAALVAAPAAVSGGPLAADPAAFSSVLLTNPNPARTISKDKVPVLNLPEDEHHHHQEESPLLQRSMEDLIHDLDGGSISSPDDDKINLNSGGLHRTGRGMSTLLLTVQKQKQEQESSPLKVLNSNEIVKPLSISPLKEPTPCSSVKKKTVITNGEKEGGGTFPTSPHLPASRTNHSGEENKIPDDPSLKEDTNNPAPSAPEINLFTLFRGLGSSGGGQDGDDETSGDTMMDDNENKSTISNVEEEVEEDEMDVEENGGANGGLSSAGKGGGGDGGGGVHRDSLGLDGPEPFQSQGSKN